MTFDYAIIGGGIVGLATALQLTSKFPAARVVVFEKENDWAEHQTGHNSGVIHSGLYYKPGSLKAVLGREGNASMVAFCRELGIEHDVCGKLIVAVDETELPRLDALYERGKANGLPVERLSPARAREIEPHVQCVAALLVPSTGIVDYRTVCRKMVAILASRGVELLLNAEVQKIANGASEKTVVSSAGERTANFVIACSGLQSDRVAKIDHVDPGAKIVPFRGEYWVLKPERRSLVRNLIYPVPNPDFPFLGVHFTRSIDGGVHAGPNAVLGFKREGYRKFDVSPRDLAEILTYGGFWRLAIRNRHEGLEEMRRSMSKRLFVRSLQRMIPEITEDDVVRAPAGVRAQALAPGGQLIDDFLLVRGERSLHVCNAPSPAATASLEIGREIVARL